MIICFDLETTGLDKYRDEIIEIALVKFDEKNFKIIDTFSTLINPKREIPEVISNITNIFDKDVINSPFLEDLKKEIKEFIWDFALLWHNVFFDRNFLIEKGINIEKNIVLDTFFLANFLCFKEQSLNLEMLCNYYNISFSWAHRAINDVKATINLFEKLLLDFFNLWKNKKELIFFVFENSIDLNIKFLKNLLFDKKYKIECEDFVKKILKVVWKSKKNWEMIINKELKVLKWENYYKKIKGLTIRENQVKMTDLIFDSFKNKKKAVIEAPTWLWKSFAYLIPSIFFSVKNWEKVFISTKTKNLQDQLFEKDLYFLEKNLWIDFNYCKLKWKKNYLYLKGFLDEFFLWDFVYEKVSFLSKIILWLFETKHWEIDELNFFWKEFLFIKILKSNFFSFQSSWDYLKYEFLYKARQNLEKSNIIIVNNSLLFSDLKNENSILWKLDNIIVDEAHSIEDSITDSLKKIFNLKWLNDIFLIIEKIFVKKKIKKIDYLNYKEELLSNLDLLIDYCFSYLNSKVSEKTKYKLILVKKDFFENAEFEIITKKINKYFLSIIDFLSRIKKFDFVKEKSILYENLDLLSIFLNQENKDKFIKIISYSENYWISLEVTLLNPWKYLEQNLYKNVKTMILTSATLKIWENFDYYKKILSLENFWFFSFKSDFDYKKQATLFIPNDLWNIKNNSQNLISFLDEFFLCVWWKTLALLTSFSMIKKIYTFSNINLKKNQINLYAQSIWWSKIKLIKSFLKSSKNSVILWTNSFWEWVDIPWDDLKYLVIHKFPFQVPSDPIFQARSVFFQDAFLEYSIPKAIIKLKQGFWRLIRTNKDKWVVILLDDRIISTKWWEKFFNAFPSDINIKINWSEVFLEILGKIWKNK